MSGKQISNRYGTGECLLIMFTLITICLLFLIIQVYYKQIEE